MNVRLSLDYGDMDVRWLWEKFRSWLYEDRSSQYEDSELNER